MKKSTRIVLATALLAGTALAVAPGQSSAQPGETNPVHGLSIRGVSQAAAAPAAGQAGGQAGKVGSNGINYHAGPIMSGTINAYVIWYGPGWSTDKMSILSDLLNGIGGSDYFNINKGYYDSTGARVSGAVTLVKSTTDENSQGLTNLSDTAIKNIVSRALTSGNLPIDANGVYFVFTSSQVSKSGFLTNYCGWHTHGSLSGADIKYSFVGDPSGPNLGNCSIQSQGPNGDAGADAMASVVAHELEEAATDPDLNAWYDNRGYENADKCAWTFGTTSTAPNGAKYNMTLGGRPFLIQRNWVNASGGYCALA
jgi:hypothetical protein